MLGSHTDDVRHAVGMPQHEAVGLLRAAREACDVDPRRDVERRAGKHAIDERDELVVDPEIGLLEALVRAPRVIVGARREEDPAVRLGRSDELLRHVAADPAETRQHDDEGDRQSRITRHRVGDEQERRALAARQPFHDRRLASGRRALPASVELRRERERGASDAETERDPEQADQRAPHAASVDLGRAALAPERGISCSFAS